MLDTSLELRTQAPVFRLHHITLSNPTAKWTSTILQTSGTAHVANGAFQVELPVLYEFGRTFIRYVHRQSQPEHHYAY